jgi:hypothetical protein
MRRPSIRNRPTLQELNMSHRYFLSAITASIIVAVVCLGTVSVFGQGPSAAPRASASASKPYVPPRTADGQPDLSGYWTNSTYIPLERPKGVTKEFYTPEEMAKMERDAAAREVLLSQPGTPSDVHYDEAQFGLTRSQIKFARSLRTSLIFDPPDGRMPPTTAEAEKRNAEIAAARKARGGPLDSVQNMAFDDRCIMMVGNQPPIFHPGYLTNYQIIQTPGWVTILNERLHDARIIPLDGRPFPSPKVRGLTGISRGRWEGNTLVVETRNSDGKVQAAVSGPMSNQLIVGASPDMRIIERFTRIDAETIQYRFTIEDERTWERPWSGEMPFVRMDPQGPMFEMACHEGNRAPGNMLSVARHQERMAAGKKGSN